MHTVTEKTEDRRNLIGEARRKIEVARTEGGITEKDLEWESLGLTETRIKRCLNPDNPANHKALSSWLREIGIIVGRLNEVRQEKGLQKLSWEKLFDPSFPRPDNFVDFTTLGRAHLGNLQIVAVAAPLIQQLKADFQAQHSNSNFRKAGSIVAHLCQLLELTENWTEIAVYSGKMAELNKKTEDFHYTADSFLRQGQALYYAKKLDKAEVSLRAGLEEIKKYHEKVPPYRTKLRLLNYMVMVTSAQGDDEGALRMAEGECLPLATDHCSDTAVAAVQNRIGILNFKLAHNDIARESLIKALETRVSKSMISECAKSLYTLAACYRVDDNLHVSLFLYQLSAKLQVLNCDFEVLSDTQFTAASILFDLVEKGVLPISFEADTHLPSRLRELLRPLCRFASFHEIRISEAVDAVRMILDHLGNAGFSASSEDFKAKIARLRDAAKAILEG